MKVECTAVGDAMLMQPMHRFGYIVGYPNKEKRLVRHHNSWSIYETKTLQ